VADFVQEAMNSGNVSEACRRNGIALALYYQWKDSAEQSVLDVASFGKFWLLFQHYFA
jgi:transposase-like protein